MKKLIITRYPSLTLLFNGFYKSLRHNLRIQYDERADTTLTDIIKHHEPLTEDGVRTIIWPWRIHSEMHLKLGLLLHWSNQRNY